MGGQEDGGIRVFRLSIDVRSFKAGVRFPARAANVFVKVVLPHQIVKLALQSPSGGNAAAKLTAPLRTHPPVLVERGMEVSIPNGYVALEIPASVFGLAATFAENPQLVAEVLQRDKYAADSILGIARIPMAPLMHEPWVDGHAPVYLYDSFDQETNKVHIGILRVLLAAEELGVVNGLQKNTNKGHEITNVPSSVQISGLEESFALLKNYFGQHLCSKSSGVQTDGSNAFPVDISVSNQEKAEFSEAKKNYKCSVAVQAEPSDLGKPQKNELSRVKAGKDEIEGLRQRPEYELAWEFEMWRRSEEAKWRMELKEKEAAKLRTCEEEWKKRENARTFEIDKLRTGLSDLESKFRSKLLLVEKRERALILAEEEASLRRDALEREYAQRTTDAEVAVKRIEKECEIRLQLENEKYAVLKEQYAALEARLGNANVQLASVEKEFADYRATQRSRSEAELCGQVLLLKHQCYELQRKAEMAIKSRDEYKAQVLRMAKELAAFYRQTKQESGTACAQDKKDDALASLVATQTQKANEDKIELKLLREQLERLQMHEQTAMAAATAAAVATAAVSQRNPVPEKKIDVMSGFLSKDDSPSRDKKVKPTLIEQLPDDELTSSISLHGHDLDHQQEQVVERNKLHASSAFDRDEGSRKRSVENELNPMSNDNKTIGWELSHFQKSEISRLCKQKEELLQTGVYTVNDRIIKGLDQEIKRLESVDTDVFSL